MTEKNYNPNQKERSAMSKQSKTKLADNTPKEKTPKQEDKIEEKVEGENQSEGITKEELQKTEDKKEKHEKGEIKKTVKKIKKEEVYVNATSVPVSTKYAMNICKFVKGKRIGDAIRDLEQVTMLKKAVPMKGEYAHKKGKGMSSGRYPQRAAKHFIVLLKSLAGNANNHEILEPIIVEARANWAPAPRGRFGRVRRKRTHITLRAVEMKIKENKNKEKKK
ncbi:MAG: uL22 family ribosomal protein [Nanobdellota archaeon]